MRFLTLAAVSICWFAGPSWADGARAPAALPHRAGRLSLPPPQSSVVVTIERGVRVWRPVSGAVAMGDGGNDPRAANAPERAPPTIPTYGSYTRGLSGGYGYGGYGHGPLAWYRNDRLNAAGTSVNTQRLPRYATGAIPAYGYGNGSVGGRPVHVIVNFRPTGPFSGRGYAHVGHGLVGYGAPGPAIAGRVSYGAVGRGGGRTGGHR